MKRTEKRASIVRNLMKLALFWLWIAPKLALSPCPRPHRGLGRGIDAANPIILDAHLAARAGELLSHLVGLVGVDRDVVEAASGAGQLVAVGALALVLGRVRLRLAAARWTY
jgi:hypothetical protein